MIINVGPIERTLLHKSAMLVKVEPADSGGSFESAIVPRIKETLLQPSKLQVFFFQNQVAGFSNIQGPSLDEFHNMRYLGKTAEI